MVVWIKTRNGESIRLVDKWHNSIYVSADTKTALQWLAKHGRIQTFLFSSENVKRREYASDYDEREVLRLVLKRAAEAEKMAKMVEDLASFGDYRIYNADLMPAQVYFIEKDLFTLAKVRVEKTDGDRIGHWELLDRVESEDYELPTLRRAILRNEPEGRLLQKASGFPPCVPDSRRRRNRGVLPGPARSPRRLDRKSPLHHRFLRSSGRRALRPVKDARETHDVPAALRHRVR